MPFLFTIITLLVAYPIIRWAEKHARWLLGK